MENFEKQGKLFEGIIRSKGYTVYSFSKKCQYTKSAMYRLVKGERDIMGVEFYNFVIFARILGFETVDEFAKALQLDLLEDIK